MDLNECSGEGMYFPSDECDDCDALIGRVESLEENKQDKLSAGENIMIENNVISSTGGGATYTAGTNIHIEDDVISAPNVYNKTEVNELLRDVSSIHMEVVTTLPTTGQSNVIYLLDDGLGNYEQWVYTETDGWIDLGGEEVDLSNYYTKTQADTLLADKQDKLTAGTNVTITGNTISATDTKYTAGTNISISSGNVISAPNVYSKTQTDTLLNNKQNTLTAGTNIDITNNVISTTGPKIWQSTPTLPNFKPTNTGGSIVSVGDFEGSMPQRAGKYTIMITGHINYGSGDGGGVYLRVYYGSETVGLTSASTVEQTRAKQLSFPFAITGTVSVDGTTKLNMKYSSSNLVSPSNTIEVRNIRATIIGVES